MNCEHSRKFWDTDTTLHAPPLLGLVIGTQVDHALELVVYGPRELWLQGRDSCHWPSAEKRLQQGPRMRTLGKLRLKLELLT